MTSHKELLELHSIMTTDQNNLRNHSMNIRSDNKIVAFIGSCCGASGLIIFLAILAHATVSTLIAVIFCITLMVLPVCLISRASGRKKLHALAEAFSRSRLDYQLSIHSVLAAQGWAADNIVARNNADENPYLCLASKDGEVHSISATAYVNGIVFNVSKEHSVMVPWSPDNTA